MAKISFKTMLNGNDIAFTIIEMDERARCGKQYKASNGMWVSSNECPELQRNGVYLRGNLHSYDKSIVILSFDTHNEAIEYKDKVIAALKEWTKKAPCFNESANYDTIGSSICEKHEF